GVNFPSSLKSMETKLFSINPFQRQLAMVGSMNEIHPVLACGPDASVFVFLIGCGVGLISSAISIVSGIVCLCKAKKTLGLWLVSTPLVFMTTFAIWAYTHYSSLSAPPCFFGRLTHSFILWVMFSRYF